MFGERRADRNSQQTWQTNPKRLPELQTSQLEKNKITVIGCGKATCDTIGHLRETQPKNTSILELSSGSKISKTFKSVKDAVSVRKWNRTMNLFSNSEVVILIVDSDDNSSEVATALAKSARKLGGINLVMLELPNSGQKKCEGEPYAYAYLVRTLIETIQKTDFNPVNFNDLRNLLEQGGFAIAEVEEVSPILNPAEEATPYSMKDFSFHVDFSSPRSTFIENSEKWRASTQRIYPIGTQLDPNVAVQGLHRRMRMTLFLSEDGLLDFNRLSLLTPQLYAMEKTSQTDKRLQLDIGLYQMETP